VYFAAPPEMVTSIASRIFASMKGSLSQTSVP
jgi:hypothetical protein